MITVSRSRLAPAFEICHVARSRASASCLDNSGVRGLPKPTCQVPLHEKYRNKTVVLSGRDKWQDGSKSQWGWPRRRTPGNRVWGLQLARKRVNRVWGRQRISMAIMAPVSGSALWAALISCAAIAQVLERRTALGARLSAPLLAMLAGMLLSGGGLIPTTAPQYDQVWSGLMPLAVALSLLETDVRRAFTDAGAALTAFGFGALGTILGTLIAFATIGETLGPSGWKMAACLCASYIGGTINYAATAQTLGLDSGGMLAAGLAADNFLMAAYFGIIMMIPERSPMPAVPASEQPVDVDAADQMLPHGTLQTAGAAQLSHDSSGSDGLQEEGLEVAPSVESLCVALAAAGTACALGEALSACLPPGMAGVELGATAVLASVFSATAAAMHSQNPNILGQSPRVGAFAGAEMLGGTLMLVFFAVIGATAGLRDALTAGGRLIAFGGILLAAHLAIILGLGRMANLPLPTVLIASNANVGGPATAAAMAHARGWQPLVRPALVIGTLGYTVGTAIGCLVGVQILRPMATALF